MTRQDHFKCLPSFPSVHKFQKCRFPQSHQNIVFFCETTLLFCRNFLWSFSNILLLRSASKNMLVNILTTRESQYGFSAVLSDIFFSPPSSGSEYAFFLRTYLRHLAEIAFRKHLLSGVGHSVRSPRDFQTGLAYFHVSHFQFLLVRVAEKQNLLQCSFKRVLMPKHVNVHDLSIDLSEIIITIIEKWNRVLEGFILNISLDIRY